MLDFQFDLEDRKTQIAFLILILLVLGSAYYFFSSEKEYKMEIVKPVHPKKEKKFEEVSLKKEIINKKEITKKIENFEENPNKIEEKKEFENKIEDKKTILFSSADSSGRYTIQLISDFEITIENKYSTSYVPMNGKIEDESQKGNFTLSLSEDYLDYVSDLKLIVKDITKKERKLECSASFLSGVDIYSEYQIKLEVLGNSLNCYIESEKKLPDFIIDDIKQNTRPIIINTDEHNKGLKIPEKFKIKSKKSQVEPNK